MPTRAGDLTAAEASALLGGKISPDSVARAIRTGKMEGYRVGPIWFTTREAVEEYRQKHLGHKGWKTRKKQTGPTPDQEG